MKIEPKNAHQHEGFIVRQVMNTVGCGNSSVPIANVGQTESCTEEASELRHASKSERSCTRITNTETKLTLTSTHLHMIRRLGNSWCEGTRN